MERGQLFWGVLSGILLIPMSTLLYYIVTPGGGSEEDKWYGVHTQLWGGRAYPIFVFYGDDEESERVRELVTPFLSYRDERKSFQFNFCRLEQDRQLAARLNVRTVPTLIIGDPGNVCKTHVGGISTEELGRLLEIPELLPPDDTRRSLALNIGRLWYGAGRYKQRTTQAEEQTIQNDILVRVSGRITSQAPKTPAAEPAKKSAMGPVAVSAGDHEPRIREPQSTSKLADKGVCPHCQVRGMETVEFGIKVCVCPKCGHRLDD